MKKITSLRLARMVQWTSGGVGWLAVSLVYRILIPCWKGVKRLSPGGIVHGVRLGQARRDPP
jgi:hypothetical protein